MMRRILILLALGASLICAQPSSATGAKSGVVADANPPLHEVFSDLSKLLRRSDPARGNALKARLVETEEEINLLENLLRMLDRGVLVEIPKVLQEPLSDDVTEETLKREQERTNELERQLQLEVARAKRRRNTHRPAEDRPTGPSELARATLAVQFEIPVPPATNQGTPTAASAALDPVGLGRSLYLSRDFSGALNAFGSIPKDVQSLEVQFLAARCLDRLGRFSEAKPIYEAVQAADSKGHFGGLAEWMLRFGGKSETVKGILAGKKEASERKEP